MGGYSSLVARVDVMVDGGSAPSVSDKRLRSTVLLLSYHISVSPTPWRVPVLYAFVATANCHAMMVMYMEDSMALHDKTRHFMGFHGL